MKKKINYKKIFIRILIVLFIIYIISVIVNQQDKLNSYKQSQAYYESKLSEEQDRQNELKSLKENIDSPEYIEQLAREKLDMYLPNERVYIDINSK